MVTGPLVIELTLVKVSGWLAWGKCPNQAQRGRKFVFLKLMVIAPSDPAEYSSFSLFLRPFFHSSTKHIRCNLIGVSAGKLRGNIKQFWRIEIFVLTNRTAYLHSASTTRTVRMHDGPIPQLEPHNINYNNFFHIKSFDSTNTRRVLYILTYSVHLLLLLELVQIEFQPAQQQIT